MGTHRSPYAKISYAEVTHFEQVQLGKVPVLRLVGPNREVINIDARKYNVDQIIAVLS